MAEIPLPVDRPVDQSSKIKEQLWLSVDRPVDQNKQRVGVLQSVKFRSKVGRPTGFGQPSGRPGNVHACTYPNGQKPGRLGRLTDLT